MAQSGKTNPQHIYPIVFVIKKGERFGIIDREGTQILEPRFAFLGRCSEGLICFKEQEEFGFIDFHGNVVIGPRFQCSPGGSHFSGGIARVGLPGNQFYINRTGHRQFSESFAFCTDFKDGLAIVKSDFDGAFAIINETGARLGELAVTEVPDVPEWPEDWNLFGCFVAVGHRLLVGMFNSSGECLFPATYPAMTNFCDGIAGFCEHDSSYRRPYGLVDLQGAVTKPPQYFDMGAFEEGLARAGRSHDQVGFINPQGDWVIEPQHRRAQGFSEGLACVTDSKRKSGFINRHGDIVIEPRFDSQGSFQKGFAQMSCEGKSVLINSSGKIIWEGD